jgi:4-cresol dehydrogenase (hydroxylating)
MPHSDRTNLLGAPAHPATPPRAPLPNLERAVAAWIKVVGEGFVKADSATCDVYGRTTGIESRRPLAVVCPESTAQVQEVLRIASTYGVGVYPISRGKNWGYGDSCPMRGGQAVLDLRRMNRIVEVNDELCYAVIEPGVTQGQLYDHLRTNHPRLWMDSSGAGREASVIGNALDRGFGHTRYGDHFLTTCGLEVVLADGRVLNTGLGHYENARAGRVYRYGTGPFLDGLFSQSNFGVVTRAGVWLMPRPEAFAGFFMSASRDEDLGELVGRLTALRIQGLLQSTIHIGNDLRVISGRRRYPWEEALGQTPLPTDLRARLRNEEGVGVWNVAGALSGSRETVAAARRALARAMRPYKVVFLTDGNLAFARRLQQLLGRWGKGLGERLDGVEPVYGLLKGIPTDEPLRGAAWRVRGAPASDKPMDPLDCDAGLLWVSPVLPATAACAREVMSIVEPAYAKYGFDACATFTYIAERALVCVTNISFDRREPDEVRRARDCYDEVTGRLIARGYIPYRSGPEGMSKLGENSAVFWDVAAQIKRALDPNGLISAGRYEPPRPVTTSPATTVAA